MFNHLQVAEFGMHATVLLQLFCTVHGNVIVRSEHIIQKYF